MRCNSIGHRFKNTLKSNLYEFSNVPICAKKIYLVAYHPSIGSFLFVAVVLMCDLLRMEIVIVMRFFFNYNCDWIIFCLVDHSNQCVS